MQAMNAVMALHRVARCSDRHAVDDLDEVFLAIHAPESDSEASNIISYHIIYFDEDVICFDEI